MPLFLYVVAFVLLLLAAFGVGFRRVAFGWLALAIIVFTWQLLPHLM